MSFCTTVDYKLHASKDWVCFGHSHGAALRRVPGTECISQLAEGKVLPETCPWRLGQKLEGPTKKQDRKRGAFKETGKRPPLFALKGSNGKNFGISRT